ncbi:hypothetical protein [Heyndrickxia oleronia]|uniref:hypothetical protein n=1 Tax=Heyndrickxia oleronia TaxID=38875 RepID=UPI001B0AD81E|nr:hypothetical protein [Heyndrickxia oleronia]GIN38401.1 hypothetical protein J19TS1_13500 [Heyndrickxia oleronia]
MIIAINNQKVAGACYIAPGLIQRTEEDKRQYNENLERNRQYIQEYKAKNGITTQFEKEMYL